MHTPAVYLFCRGVRGAVCCLMAAAVLFLPIFVPGARCVCVRASIMP